jgi:hypothetical protein
LRLTKDMGILQRTRGLFIRQVARRRKIGAHIW